VRINGNGSLTTIATGLTFPTAMTFGPDGNLYVSNFGFGVPAAGAGEIVRIDLSSDNSRPAAAALLSGNGTAFSSAGAGVSPPQRENEGPGATITAGPAASVLLGAGARQTSDLLLGAIGHASQLGDTLGLLDPSGTEPFGGGVV
jgi:hypothetical protein